MLNILINTTNIIIIKKLLKTFFNFIFITFKVNNKLFKALLIFKLNIFIKIFNSFKVL
jgi:hypothetical protein